MKKNLTFILIIFLAISNFAIGQKSDGPKLVVGIVVDQMRWDYFYRFYNRYSENGFKRLLNEGFSFENCMITHLPAHTAIGHSTIYTGSIPSIHGIAGNVYMDQKTGKSIYCTEDSTVLAVGDVDPTDMVGKMSPKNLRVTTIGDQLKYSTNFRSKVIGISLKDRASILPAGHAADWAFWLDAKTGKWITSSWYGDKLPQWVSDYNKLDRPRKYLNEDWNPLYDIDSYVQSAPNKQGRYEEPLKTLENPGLPMKTSELLKNEGVNILGITPGGNQIIVDLAKLAIENERLGEDNITDFLALSFSTPDKAAHAYTIHSILTEDLYLRLDKQLADFFDYLDKKVGKGSYLVFLTADHGATPNVQFAADHKIPGSIESSAAFKKNINEYLKSFYNVSDIVRSCINSQVHLNYDLIEKNKLDLEKVKESIINWLHKQDNVLYAVDMKKVSEATLPALIKEKIINSYNRDFSGEIQIIIPSGSYFSGTPKGGTHGEWTPDDCHIPFVLMGWGIQHGQSLKEISMADIAPTLSSLLKIERPNGSIGVSAFD